jgi:hypothetical protein
MRRPLLVGALATAVIALVASAAVAAGTLGRPSGPSMMGGSSSMMGGSMMGSAGGMGMTWLPGDGVAVTAIPAARARAASAAKPAGLHPGEVMWFDNGFYVELKDAAGKPATEVIVDPRTGAVSTEPGPAMMWNTRFGMHAGSQGANTVSGAVDATKARAIATSWLGANRAGTTDGLVGLGAFGLLFLHDVEGHREVPLAIGQVPG